MPAVIHGEQFLYGVDGTFPDCAVQSASFKSDFINKSEVIDENGNRICIRLDDKDDTIQLEVVPKNAFEAPIIGGTFTFQNIKYMCETSELKSEAKGFRKYSITGKKPEYITLT